MYTKLIKACSNHDYKHTKMKSKTNWHVIQSTIHMYAKTNIHAIAKQQG